MTAPPSQLCRASSLPCPPGLKLLARPSRAAGSPRPSSRMTLARPCPGWHSTRMAHLRMARTAAGLSGFGSRKTALAGATVLRPSASAEVRAPLFIHSTVVPPAAIDALLWCLMHSQSCRVHASSARTSAARAQGCNGSRPANLAGSSTRCALDSACVTRAWPLQNAR
jgi:hypothetical protein